MVNTRDPSKRTRHGLVKLKAKSRFIHPEKFSPNIFVVVV